MINRPLFEITETEYLPRLELIKPPKIILSERQAWELSIEKWTLISQICAQGKLIDDGGVQTCALCSLYFFGHTDECEECPIKDAGFPGCSNTLYKEYLSALKIGALDLAKQAAADEIIFLRSLYGSEF